MSEEVAVRQVNEGAWTIENAHLSVRLVREGLGLEVTDKQAGKTWTMEPESKGFMVQKYGIQLVKPLDTLNLADWREVREGEFRGVELRSVQPDPWQQYCVGVRVLLARDEPELRVSVTPHEDPGYNAETWIREVYYPRSFVHSASAHAYTLLPLQQGVMLSGDWPEDIREDRARHLLRVWAWQAVTGPWWGHIDEGGAGYLAIMDTPDDTEFDFDHPAGGPTRIAPYWTTSWEAFRYQRRMIYRFFPRADHAKIALAYRDYCKRIGRWRSLEEKRLEKPQIDKLRGAIRLRIRAVLTHLGGDEIRREFRTFDEIGRVIDETVAANPGESIHFTLAGWQTLGYDHAHPAACPPNEEAGGWEGMRRLSELAARHDILFGVHDQYRDFYLSSPFWSEERTRKDSRRDSPRHAYWAGGTQSILCPALMLDFIKMNVQQLRDQKIKLNATYQDVLTAIALEECFDERHPLTRTGCREARFAIFDYYRELGWVIASESAADWAAPGVDYFNVHWAGRRGEDGLEPLGVPVPLFGLVFHDSTVLLTRRTPPLICALSGVNTMRAEDRLLRRLHAATAYMPLTASRLLSDDGMRQESVFGDSVRVVADLAEQTYEITGLEGEGELSGRVEDGNL